MNTTAAYARRQSVAGVFAGLLLLGGCSRISQSLYLSQRDSEIRRSTAAIAAAKNDAQRAVAYADRGDAYTDKARYLRIMKLIGDEDYKKTFDLGITDFNQAIALNPENAETYYRRGTAYYLRAGQDMIYDVKATKYLTPARADFSKAAEKNPREAKVFDMLGLVDASLQDWSQAIADFEKEAALDAHSRYRLSDAYCNRGSAYLNEGKYDLAVADLSRSIELPGHSDPCECDPYNSLLTVYVIKTHEYEKAQTVVARARQSGRYIGPEYLEQLNAAKGKK